MAVYITISEDITKDILDQIKAGIKKDPEVYIVNGMCLSLQGRKKLAFKLKQKGLDDDVVRRLGWKTYEPEKPKKEPKKNAKPSPSTTPADPKPVPSRKRENSKRSS